MKLIKHASLCASKQIEETYPTYNFHDWKQVIRILDKAATQVGTAGHASTNISLQLKNLSGCIGLYKETSGNDVIIVPYETPHIMYRIHDDGNVTKYDRSSRINTFELVYYTGGGVEREMAREVSEHRTILGNIRSFLRGSFGQSAGNVPHSNKDVVKDALQLDGIDAGKKSI